MTNAVRFGAVLPVSGLGRKDNTFVVQCIYESLHNTDGEIKVQNRLKQKKRLSDKDLMQGYVHHASGRLFSGWTDKQALALALKQAISKMKDASSCTELKPEMVPTLNPKWIDAINEHADEIDIFSVDEHEVSDSTISLADMGSETRYLINGRQAALIRSIFDLWPEIRIQVPKVTLFETYQSINKAVSSIIGFPITALKMPLNEYIRHTRIPEDTIRSN